MTQSNQFTSKPPNFSPCPFCTNADLHIEDNSPQPSSWWVTCNACGAEGPFGDSNQAAIVLWNERAIFEVIRQHMKDARGEIARALIMGATDYRRGFNDGYEIGLRDLLSKAEGKDV